MAAPGTRNSSFAERLTSAVTVGQPAWIAAAVIRQSSGDAAARPR